MKKPWSITTTTRNPFRLRSQLAVLDRECVGRVWDREAQVKFQVLLIQNRLYGYQDETGFSAQFLNGLSTQQKSIFTDFEYELSYNEALDIFNSKNYRDPAMRGRQSFNPHKKMGFVQVDAGRILRLTSLGAYFLSEDYDLSEIFFRSFLKWQIPNPDSRDYRLKDGYDIKPFIGTLHLINEVNTLWEEQGHSRKGISKSEFMLFVPTLVNYSDISDYAKKIIMLRHQQLGKTKREKQAIHNQYKVEFAKDFLGNASTTEINKLLDNLKDYGDNTIRYFRFTNLLYIRGGGFYIDLEPRRHVEIKSLLDYDDASSDEFATLEAYQSYLSDILLPVLPWETSEKFDEVIDEVVRDITATSGELGLSADILEATAGESIESKKKYLHDLREYRRKVQEKSIHKKAQSLENINECIGALEDIFNSEDRPIELERLAALGLHALNDAIEVKPNYPVGDDNEPLFTAPANVPDIECFYDSMNTICEVTMLASRDQYYNEGQPVMRHLRDFESKFSDKPTYCVFVAPVLHRDTVNTYWVAVKYEYEGEKQRIVPLTIAHYVQILQTLVAVKSQNRQFSHTYLVDLYDRIITLTTVVASSVEWVEAIPSTIDGWSKETLTISFEALGR